MMPKDPQKDEAYRRVLSSLFRGRKFSETHKKKLSEAKLRNPVRYWLGKKRNSDYVRKPKTRDPEIVKQWTARRKIQRNKDLETLAGRPKPEKCEVCGKNGRICFDHDHNNGNFRGWICEQCNVILGYARDNPEILKLLAQYLEEKK